MSIIVRQSLSWEIEPNAFLKFTKHRSSWRSRALFISILRFVIWSLVLLPCRNPGYSSALKRHFRFGLHSDPFQYGPKKDLACVGDNGNCSVVCTLFKVTFLGKWDERGERSFLWPLTSYPNRHTYSVHSVKYCFSCFEQFCWDLIRTCGYAT